MTEQGVKFRSTSDSELIAAMIATTEAPTLEDAIAEIMPELQGAFATVVMSKDRCAGSVIPSACGPS